MAARSHPGASARSDFSAVLAAAPIIGSALVAVGLVLGNDWNCVCNWPGPGSLLIAAGAFTAAAAGVLLLSQNGRERSGAARGALSPASAPRAHAPLRDALIPCVSGVETAAVCPSSASTAAPHAGLTSSIPSVAAPPAASDAADDPQSPPPGSAASEGALSPAGAAAAQPRAATTAQPSALRPAAADAAGVAAAETTLREPQDVAAAAAAAAAGGGDGRVIAAESLEGVALTLSALGRHEKALANHQQALELRAAALPQHPETARSLENVALALGALGRHEDALVRHRAALEMRVACCGPLSLDAAGSHDLVGWTLGQLGRHDEALTSLKEGLGLRLLALEGGHIPTVQSLVNVGVSLHALGRRDEALAVEQNAPNTHAGGLGELHLDTARSLSSCGATLTALERHDEALTTHLRAANIRTAILGAEHRDAVGSLDQVGLALGKLGRHEEALEIKECALKIRLAALTAPRGVVRAAAAAIPADPPRDARRGRGGGAEKYGDVAAAVVRALQQAPLSASSHSAAAAPAGNMLRPDRSGVDAAPTREDRTRAGGAHDAPASQGVSALGRAKDEPRCPEALPRQLLSPVKEFAAAAALGDKVKARPMREGAHPARDRSVRGHRRRLIKLRRRDDGDADGDAHFECDRRSRPRSRRSASVDSGDVAAMQSVRMPAAAGVGAKLAFQDGTLMRPLLGGRSAECGGDVDVQIKASSDAVTIPAYFGGEAAAAPPHVRSRRTRP